jgi:nucleoside phosphorylase
MSRSSNGPRLSPADYTVACICPMGIELAPVEALLDEEHPALPLLRHSNAYTLGRMCGHNIVVAIMPQIGNNAAADVASRLQVDFPSVKLCLLVGIGGGVPGRPPEDDVRLGDIVVSQPSGTLGGVVQFDMGKATAGGVWQPTGVLNKPPRVLTAHVERLKSRHLREGSQVSRLVAEMLAKYPRMAVSYAYPAEAHDRLFEATYNHEKGPTCELCDQNYLVHRPHRRDQDPVVHYGIIGSSNAVIKDGVMRERVKKEWNILCVGKTCL